MSSAASTSSSGSAEPVVEQSVAAAELESALAALEDVRLGAASFRDTVTEWRERFSTTKELVYPNGISLLNLKNHTLLSYLHHLVALCALRLTAQSLGSQAGEQVVAQLVKDRLVLDKIAPLESKLRYQIEKLVRKADTAAEPQNDEDMLNDPLAFRANPANFGVDKRGDAVEDREGVYNDGSDDDVGKSGVYRPPRIAAVPYVEPERKGKGKNRRNERSHEVSDMATSLAAKGPYSEAASGLSVSVDPALQSGTARHLKQVEDYELDNFTRMHMSKRDSKRRRREEEEVAFGGLGAGKGGRRRLGGFGAEFDDILHSGGKRSGQAYDSMRAMKRARTSAQNADDSIGSKGKAGKSEFEKAAKRAGRKKRHSKS